MLARTPGLQVQQHLDAASARGTSSLYIAALLLLFGSLFNLHQIAQAAVFKTEGAIGVGLVNAVRGEQGSREAGAGLAGAAACSEKNAAPRAHSSVLQCAAAGAVITLVIAALFCTGERPHLCLTRQTLLSALVTTTGGAIFVLSGQRHAHVAPKPPTTRAAAKAGTEGKKDS